MYSGLYVNCVCVCVYIYACISCFVSPGFRSPSPDLLSGYHPTLSQKSRVRRPLCVPPTDSFCGFFVCRSHLLLLTGNQQHAHENTTAYSNTFPFLCFPFFYMFWITIELADWQTDTGRRSLFLRLASAHAKKVSIKFINSENIIIKNVR
jgi:hypothetical protein